MLGFGHKPLTYTLHAGERMTERCLTPNAIEVAEEWGRVVYTRGAVILAIGRKEVATARTTAGVDLSRLEGLTVVTSSEGVVVTAYRNRDLSGLRRSCNKRRWKPEKWEPRRCA